MKNLSRSLGMMIVALLGLVLAGCASYYPSGDRGVYQERPVYRSARLAYVDPHVYPYWSLDYFYYSRHYHPYSVLVDRWDPWYYPYPGWYYGYWPGPRFAGYGGRYHSPWYRHGGRYAGYRYWQPGVHLSFGRHDRRDAYNRVRELDSRLGALETRRSQLVRAQRPTRPVMAGASPWLPATGRGAAADERSRPAASGAAVGSYGRRAAAQRQALINRLRAAERDARPIDPAARSRDRSLPPPQTRVRPTPPPQRRSEPAPPVRQRSAPPSPPRSRPQPSRERSDERSSRRTRPPQPH